MTKIKFQINFKKSNTKYDSGLEVQRTDNICRYMPIQH